VCFFLLFPVAVLNGYIDVFRPLDGKKKNNVPYQSLLTVAKEWCFRVNGFPANTNDVFGPDFNCQAVKMSLWKALEKEIDNGRLEMVQWTAGCFISWYLSEYANYYLEELCFVPGTMEYNNVPLIVDTNGKVLRKVSDAINWESRSNGGADHDIFSSSDWDLHGFQEAALFDPHMDNSSFLGYQVENGSVHTPDVQVLDNHENETWLRSTFDRDEADEDEDEVLLSGQGKHPYTKPPASKTSGLLIKTTPRGELGSHAYQFMKVGSSVSVPTHSVQPHPVLSYPASISAPHSKPILPPSARLIHHREPLQTMKLGRVADSNFSTSRSSSQSHSVTSSHAGPSKFPGAYVDDNRATKKVRKF